MYSEFGSPETHMLGRRGLDCGRAADDGSSEGGAGAGAGAGDGTHSGAPSLMEVRPIPVISTFPRRGGGLACVLRARCMTIVLSRRLSAIDLDLQPTLLLRMRRSVYNCANGSVVNGIPKICGKQVSD